MSLSRSVTPPPRPVQPGRQLSLFGVEAADPSPADLAGLLAGPGQVVRMGGTARVSIVVDAAWRVHVLVAELAARGLAATWVTTADAHLGVRTAYARSLAPLGVAWLRGAVKRPPTGFHLDGPRLRLWAAAAGSPGPLGFLLRLGPSDEECWSAIGAALAAVGLPAVLVGPRAGRAAPAGPEEPSADPDPDPDPDPAPDADADAEPGPLPNRAALLGANPEQGTPVPLQAGTGQPASAPTEPTLITGPAYRITGRRRLARLAELVGERPPAAPADAWPE